MTIINSNIRWIKPTVLPWIILFFAALNVIFMGGKRRAFGGFVAELRKDFPNVTLTELNWIGSSYGAFAYMTSSITTTGILYFNRRYGLSQLIGSLFILFSSGVSSFVPNPHWLFLTHTLFHGIGSSMVVSTIGLVVNEYFDMKHPYHILATTLVSGGSLAAVAFVYLFAFIIKMFDWRMAFIIVGVIYFVVNASASVVFRRNDQILEWNAEMVKNTITFAQVPLLILWFIERVLTSVVTCGLLLNLTDYLYRSQPDLVRSTILTTLFTAGEGTTYLIAAIIAAKTKDFFRNKLRYILLASSLILSIALITMEFTSHMVITSRVLSALCGFAIGPSNSLLFPAGEELTRLPGHMAYPFTLGGMGVGMLISPLLTAKVAEMYHYTWFFFVQGCLIFVKAICILSIIVILFFNNSLQNECEDQTKETNVDAEADSKFVNERTKLISEFS